MTLADLDQVMEIAGSLKEAPHWPRSAYLAALEPEAAPLRIALVAEHPRGAKAPADSVGVMRGLKPPPPSESYFSASCEEGECEGVVGFLVASLLATQAELEIIAVAPQLQRRGLAGRLFAVLAAELRTAPVTEVILEVRATNQPALEFYGRLGFVETGRRMRYYHDPVEDAILMRFWL
jgi:ribosomal protein S18 acetylase RimI-like enzyme